MQTHDVHSEPGSPPAQTYTINKQEYLIAIVPLTLFKQF